MKLDLSTKEGYDIASAIRGPDIYDEMAQYIKMIFTAPIRHLVGSDTGLFRKLDEAPEIWCSRRFTPEEVYTYAIESDWVQHYAEHTHSAFIALSKCVDDWGLRGAQKQLPILTCIFRVKSRRKCDVVSEQRLEALRHAAWGLANVHSMKRWAFCDAWRELEKTWPDNRTVTVVCHGHSVPAGYFATPIVDSVNAYPHVLFTKLKKRYPNAVVNVIVTAIGGENAVSGAARFHRCTGYTEGSSCESTDVWPPLLSL